MRIFFGGMSVKIIVEEKNEPQKGLDGAIALYQTGQLASYFNFPKLFRKPRNRFPRKFVGSVNRIGLFYRMGSALICAAGVCKALNTASYRLLGDLDPGTNWPTRCPLEKRALLLL